VQNFHFYVGSTSNTTATVRHKYRYNIYTKKLNKCHRWKNHVHITRMFIFPPFILYRYATNHQTITEALFEEVSKQISTVSIRQNTQTKYNV